MRGRVSVEVQYTYLVNAGSDGLRLHGVSNFDVRVEERDATDEVSASHWQLLELGSAEWFRRLKFERKRTRRVVLTSSTCTALSSSRSSIAHVEMAVFGLWVRNHSFTNDEIDCNVHDR